jgi:hypothetical protein
VFTDGHPAPLPSWAEGGWEGLWQDTTFARVPLVSIVGGADWGTPSADVLELSVPVTPKAKDQDVGVLKVQLPQPSLPQRIDCSGGGSPDP